MYDIYVNVAYEWYHLDTDCVKSFHSFWGDCQTDSNNMNDMIWYYVMMILYDVVVMMVWYIYVNVAYECYHLDTDCVKSFHSFWGNSHIDSINMNDMIWYYVIMMLYDVVVMMVWYICQCWIWMISPRYGLCEKHPLVLRQ